MIFNGKLQDITYRMVHSTIRYFSEYYTECRKLTNIKLPIFRKTDDIWTAVTRNHIAMNFLLLQFWIYFSRKMSRYPIKTLLWTFLEDGEKFSLRLNKRWIRRQRDSSCNNSLKLPVWLSFADLLNFEIEEILRNFPSNFQIYPTRNLFGYIPLYRIPIWCNSKCPKSHR